MKKMFPGSLHNHTQMSNFRLRDCIIKEDDLIHRAVELGHSVVAITDHETIVTAVRVEKLKKAVGDKIKIIMGNEIYLCRDGLNSENFVAGEDKYFHFILLAKDRRGFEQICELSTRAWMRSYIARRMRRVPTYYQDIIDIIGSDPGHVIGCTACLGGFLPTALMKYKENKDMSYYQKILNWCNLMQGVFGKGNFYLELQPSLVAEQIYVNEELVKISKQLDIPYIITCDSHYLKEEDRELHKAYLNSQDGDREVDEFYSATFLMSTEQVEARMKISKEDIEAGYRSIEEIKDKCSDFSILKDLNIPSLTWKKPTTTVVEEHWFEKMPMLREFENSEFEGDKVLVRAVIDGIMNHPDLQNDKSYEDINNNLDMTWVSSNVNKAHWSAYYLNLQKIIDCCWEANSLVLPGRGSGVGFILLYVLGITQINPLRETTKTFPWRFLNPERVSVLDIDFDIEGRKREDVLNKYREVYGEDRVAGVITFHKEKSKSAILTAGRGLGIDNDITQYIASLIPADRGELRTLKECYYGDEEKGFKPVNQFKIEMDNYPKLWEVACSIEGLISGYGVHAGGVIFVDEPFTKSTALMRAPNDTIITQFDLHDAEAVSLIKYDTLSVEAADKIHICLDLLCNNNLIEKKPTLRETYENALNIYKLDRDNREMWEMVWEHKILSLFQMEKQSGINGIKILKPNSVDELAILNSTIRLMTQEKGAETPTEKLARFKSDPTAWDKELAQYGLGKKEREILEPIVGISYGMCIAQEQFMELVQLPELGGFSLTWADKLRKSIAKKNPKEFDALAKEFYRVTDEKGINPRLAFYVWEVLISLSKGYGFNQSHTLAYSLVALQEMNLAYYYPIVLWNCACLISDSGTEEEDGTTNYGKIAVAISKMISEGVKIELPSINESEASFIPNIKTNEIYYGLKAIGGINEDIIAEIEKNRPYADFFDFMNKCHLNKTVMINLIKAGAFDSIAGTLENRRNIMIYYLSLVSEPKSKLNLQNLNGLIQAGMLPQEMDIERRTYNFNKYLKTKKSGNYFVIDEPSYNFLEKCYPEALEDLSIESGITYIGQKVWDKYYQGAMDKVRSWLKDNQQELLEKYNFILFKAMWDKYATGTISRWEMDSLCYYYHEHELANINKNRYGIKDFYSLDEESEVDYYFKRNGIDIPVFKLSRIAGTVLSKDDGKATVTLLCTDGVVEVKFTKEYYSMFKKQISAVQEDGSKKVIEPSWFKRGTLLMITGYRRGSQFVGKTYARTIGHQLYKIDKVDGDSILIRHERMTASGSYEEEYED